MPATWYEIALEENLKRFIFWRFSRSLPDKVARFCQVNLNRPRAHHDALEFPNGYVLLVTELPRGQRATVLQLPSTAGPERKYTRQIPELMPNSLPLGAV